MAYPPLDLLIDLFQSLVISQLISFILLGISFLLDMNAFLEYFDRNLLYICTLYLVTYYFLLYGSLLERNDKMLLIQVIGGSSAIYYYFIAKTKLQKNASLQSFFFTTVFTLIFFLPQPFYWILLFIFVFVCLFFLPKNLVAALLLIMRSFTLEGGTFLLLQIGFIFIFSYKRIKLAIPFGILYLSLILWAPISKDIVIQNFLFPFSGACAILFLLLAESGKEHWLLFLLYNLNGIIICLFLGNQIAAYYFFTLNLLVLSLLSVITLWKLPNFNFFYLSLEQFSAEFFEIVQKCKLHLLFIYYSSVVYMIHNYSHAEWMTYAATSLVLQVSFVILLQNVFETVMPEGRCGKSRGTLNEIKSVTKCYGGEVCRKKDGLLSFHKSREQTQLDEQNQLEDHIKTLRLDDP